MRGILKRMARRDAPGNVNYYLSDHLGSSRVVTNSAGTILDDCDFTPFGQERCFTSSSGNTYKFTGKERDPIAEGGKDYFPARYYANTLFRWLSPDPAGKKAANLTDPQTWNMCAYVRNNPTTLTDPTGLEVPSSCAKDPKCTIVVRVNVIYDQTVNRGKGFTAEQKQKFEKEQLEKAQKQFGTSNIKLDVSYTAGRYEVGPWPDRTPAITGLRAGYLNVVVSDATPTATAGVSGVDRRSNIALTFLNLNDVHGWNFYPFFMITTEHELGHQFLGHGYLAEKGTWDYYQKEYDVDRRLFLQSFGLSQGAFREGLEPRDYAFPADAPNQ